MKNLGLPPEFFKEEYLPQMKQMYGEPFFTQSIEDILAHYPENPMEVGDTWENGNENLPNTLAIEKHNYTLKSKDDDIAVIEVTTEIRTQPQSMMDIMIQKAKTEIKGTRQSTIEIDNQTGWIKTSVTKSKVHRMTTFGESTDNPESTTTSEEEITNTVKIHEIK